MASSVFCTASPERLANDIVSRLKASGFRDNEISILFADTWGRRGAAYGNQSQATLSAVIVGRPFAQLEGIRAFVIPGAGAFVAAGPIMAALCGLADGTSHGGITAALVSIGLSDLEARRYEGRVRDGDTLISAHTDDATSLTKAREIFTKSAATDICGALEKSAPKQQPARADARPNTAHV